jgi:predicted dehydrogenase
MKIGVVGCGNISGIYFENLARFGHTRVVACADIDHERAGDAAKAYGVGYASSPEELVNDPEVDVVLNLTVPKAHFEVSRQALLAGKHVYSEKPLAIERSEAAELLRIAEIRGLRVGCAPDTVLGAGIQTCRSIVDSGELGEIVGINGFMLCPGHEGWHPAPQFYYEYGGGPMFDMGPYYLSAFATLLGQMARIQSSARVTRPTRTITSAPHYGKTIDVQTPTHLAGVIEFESGAIGQLTTSFDVQQTVLPSIELYGTEGTLLVPDPNGFGGPVRIFRKGAHDWEDVPVTRPYAFNARGLGLLDMVVAIESGRPHRASGSLAFHVLDAFHAFHESSETGHRVGLLEGHGRPEAMPETPLEEELPAKVGG